MRFEPKSTSVMELEPQDKEARELVALEERLIKRFGREEWYIRQNTRNGVAHGKKGAYDAVGVKDVYRFIVDANFKKRLTPKQVTALVAAKKFIQKFDRSWQPPKR